MISPRPAPLGKTLAGRVPRRDEEDQVVGFIRRNFMLWTIALILLILWALGLVSSYTLGGFIHILLVLAIIVVLIRIIQGRRPVL